MQKYSKKPKGVKIKTYKERLMDNYLAGKMDWEDVKHYVTKEDLKEYKKPSKTKVYKHRQ